VPDVSWQEIVGGFVAVVTVASIILGIVGAIRSERRQRPRLRVHFGFMEQFVERNGFEAYYAHVVATNVGQVPVTVEGLPVVRPANAKEGIGVLRKDWWLPQPETDRRLEPSSSFTFKIPCVLIGFHAEGEGLSGVVQLVAAATTSHQTRVTSDTFRFDLAIPWPRKRAGSKWGLA